MTNLDYSSMSLEELKQIRREVDKAIATFKARKIAKATREVEAKAREFGFTLTQLVGGPAVKTDKVAPKYRNPENPEQAWTGRGRQPVWYQEAIAAGREPAELAI